MSDATTSAVENPLTEDERHEIERALNTLRHLSADLVGRCLSVDLVGRYDDLGYSAGRAEYAMEGFFRELEKVAPDTEGDTQ
jgi:hypothetical protein